MAARHAGANIVTGSGPATLATSGAGVTGVRVQERVIAADTVVVAAGIGTRLLCCAAGLDLPLHGSPAVRVRLRCAHPTAAMIHEGPLCEVRSVAGGILAADDWREGVPLHDIAGGVVAAVRSTYRGADDVSVVDAVVGERPMPNDGPPLIGRARGIGGLYVAVMHSGVTLAPVVADLGTREILKDTREPLLEGCRPDR
jgi:glycine/D-amino acid oxidase-like deaminating enzyme